MATGNETRTENVSRMTFSIPVIFPTSEVVNDSKRAYDERSEAIERDLVRLRRSALLADKG